MENEQRVIEVGPGVVEVITSLGNTYRSFQQGKDSVESAKQEAEFIM